MGNCECCVDDKAAQIQLGKKENNSKKGKMKD